MIRAEKLFLDRLAEHGLRRPEIADLIGVSPSVLNARQRNPMPSRDRVMADAFGEAESYFAMLEEEAHADDVLLAHLIVAVRRLAARRSPEAAVEVAPEPLTSIAKLQVVPQVEAPVAAPLTGFRPPSIPDRMVEIMARVARAYGVRVEFMAGPDRCRDAVLPRQHAMWMMKEAGYSLPRIGRAFGRDHSTVLHSVRAHERRAARPGADGGCMSKDDKPDAWMPLYIGDWDGDTGHLSCEEDGAYGRLIRHYWRNGPLPDSDRILSSITRTDTKAWKRLRPALVPFFIICNGQWTHKRVDAERLKWAEKRRRAIERASAGGKAKAAKSTATSSATSTRQAVLEQCTSSSSTEVEGPTGHSTLCGQNNFVGPKEVRAAFLSVKGDDWVRSYIDRCGWQDVPVRALIAATGIALSEIDSALRRLIREKHPDVAGLAVQPKGRAA